jgi:hypothetical protein
LSHPANPFYVGYFWDRVSLYVQAGLNHNPPVCAFPIAGITGSCHHAQTLGKMGSCKLFAGAGFKIPFSQPLISQVDRITVLNHRTQPHLIPFLCHYVYIFLILFLENKQKEQIISWDTEPKQD